MNIDVKNMNITDRLQAMEALWNSFLDEESELESPEWHQDTLEKRKTKIQSGKGEFLPLKELKAHRNS